MMLWLRLAIKDIAGNKRFSLFFVINLAIGLTGFVAIISLGSSLNRHFADNLREILTADCAIVSSRPLKAAEEEMAMETIGTGGSFSRQISLYTMVRSAQSARLVQVIAVDARYPLYGSFVLADRTAPSSALDALAVDRGLLMTAEVATSLGTGPGQMLGVGESTFRVSHLLETEPVQEVTSFTLAPKIYLSLAQLEGTGLIQYGSRLRYTLFLRYPEGTPVESVSEQLRLGFNRLEPGGDSELRVYSTRDINRRLDRLAGYFTGYLGLVGVIGLFLAGIAASYLFRSYLTARTTQIAILMSLGATRVHCALYFLVQLALLGLSSALLALVFATLLFPLLPNMVTGIVPPGLTVALDRTGVVTALFIGVGGSLLFSLPVFTRIMAIRPLILLNQGVWPSGNRRRAWLWPALSILPGLFAFTLLAIVFSQSIGRGLLFTAAVCLATGLFAGAGTLLFQACGRWSRQGSAIRRIALRNLYRNRLSSLSIFVTMAVGAFLINLIPQLQNGIEEEIGSPKHLEIPELFLVDIQEDQKDDLLAFVREEGARLTNLSPMVRGRIIAVNGISFADRPQTRERRNQEGFRRTEFNFSSRERLDRSESIVAGRPLSVEPWRFDTGEPFEISMDRHFAERHGLHLGDRILFDVQGLELQGLVVNLRKVRWSSFQPNFFLLFQQGVLDAAPKTYLAAVGGVGSQAKQSLQHRLSKRFANVSVIDVSRTIAAILQVAERLSFSLRAMAWLSFFAGLVAMFSIARHEILKHEQEINLLKVLGASFADIRRIITLEFGLLGLLAALFSVFLSYLFSYGLAWLYFDRLWAFTPASGLLVLLGTPLICTITALIATHGVVRKKAVALLA